MKIQLALIQQKLDELSLGGWLFYSFRETNPIALSFLKIDAGLLSRRFFYWVPVSGDPVKIVHKVESHVLDHLPGKKVAYASWQELEEVLQDTLVGVEKVAMEYSPFNQLPYVSYVDAGTVEMVKAAGVDVVSSADLLMHCRPKYTDQQLATHRQVATFLSEVIDRSWHWIRDHVVGESELTEFGVVDFIMCQFAASGVVADHSPICGVNAHAADPHYVPTEEKSTVIRKGDFVLIDLFGKFEKKGALYGDLCKVGVVADHPTEKQVAIFEAVKAAREAALHLLRERVKNKQPVMGYELDRCARTVIEEKGYGAFFIHRTGHDLGEELHGPGAHIDDFETRDRRPLLPGALFTIEPGIYLPGEFGVRLECDVLLTEGDIVVTGHPQQQIKSIL